MKSNSRRTFVKAGMASLVAMPFVHPARAQAWPNKTIRIVCGFPAGGLTDLLARAYGEFLQQKLGQTVVVENRTGAAGAIAARAVKASPADGYTLMFTISTTMLMNRVMFRNLGYDADTDFVRISHLSAGHLPTVASKATGASNLAEFVAYARKNEMNYGTYGPGSYAHITLATLNKHYGLQMKVVHYRGEAPMWQDLAAGVLQGACGSYAAASAVLTGNLGKAIAVPTAKRMSKLPNVGTYFEQGVTDKAFQTSGFICLVGPAGMPPEVVDQLSKLMVEGGKSERVVKINDTFGLDEAALGREQFDKIYADVGPVLIKLVRDLNLTPGEVSQ